MANNEKPSFNTPEAERAYQEYLASNPEMREFHQQLNPELYVDGQYQWQFPEAAYGITTETKPTEVAVAEPEPEPVPTEETVPPEKAVEVPDYITQARLSGQPDWKQQEAEWRREQLDMSKEDYDKLLKEEGIDTTLARLKTLSYEEREAQQRTEEFWSKVPSVEMQTYDGKTITLEPEQLRSYYSSQGKEQYNLAVELGLIPKDSKYVDYSDGRWGFIPAWSIGKEYAEAVVALGKARRELESTQLEAQSQLVDYIDVSTSELDLYGAVANDVSLERIRNAGYDVSQEQYDSIKQTISDREQTLKLLDRYKSPEGGYYLTEFIRDRVERPAFVSGTDPPDNLKAQRIDEVHGTLLKAGFDARVISQAMDEYHQPGAAIHPSEHRLDWSDKLAINLTNWNAELVRDIDRSVEDLPEGNKRLAVSAGAGLLMTGANVLTAIPILFGKAATNPAGIPALAYDTGKGMVTHVTTTGGNLMSGAYQVQLRHSNASRLVYDTTMSYLIVSGAGRVAKGTLARVTTYVTPRGIPPGLVAKEMSTGRIPVTKAAWAKAYADAINKVEQLAASREGKFTGEVPIEGTPYKLRYLKTPLQQRVGNVLFHGTKDEFGTAGIRVKESALRIAEREGRLTAGREGIYTDPWAAIAYTRGGENPGLLMIVTDAGKIKSGASGLKEGITPSDAFVRDARAGFYGSSKTWRGDLETEIVGAPGTRVNVPKPTADLPTRILAGKYSDFFTRDGNRIIPVKLGLDARNLDTRTLATLQHPSSLYAVKLYSLYGALRDASQAMRHPRLVLKDVSGILREMVNLDNYLREGRGSKGSLGMPGVRDVYLEASLAQRLKQLAVSIRDAALRRTRKQLGTKVNENSATFRRALERNMTEVYRENARAIMRAYPPLVSAYSTDSTARNKFESAYTMNLGASIDAMASSSVTSSTATREVISDLPRSLPSSPESIRSTLESFERVSPRVVERAATPVTREPRAVESVVSELIEPPRRPIIPETPRRPVVPETPRTPITPPEYPVTPPVPPPVIKDDKEVSKRLVAVPPGTIAWRQGIYWETLKPPYEQDDLKHHRQAPPGVYKFATGEGSAYKTVQVLGGPPTKDADVDLGFVIVHLRKKDNDVTIDFSQDPEDVYRGKSITEKIPKVKRDYSTPKYTKEENGRIQLTEEPSFKAQLRKKSTFDEAFDTKPLRKAVRRDEEETSSVSERYYLGRRLRPAEIKVNL